MIKQLFFIAVLLVPGLACAGNPSADLSVQVVNANPPTPPPGAVAAGFTTLAANYDFATPFYGTLSNWLDCAGATHPQWYNVVYGNGPAPCSDYSIISDGGIQVLDIRYTHTDYTNNINATDMATSPLDIDAKPDFPQELYIEFRSKVPAASQTACPPGTVGYCALNDFFTWQTPFNGGTAPMIEWDFLEMYGPTSGSNGGCNHPSSGASIGGLDFCTPGPESQSGYDPTVYNTYAVRITSDGSTGTYRCDYLNGVQYHCGGQTGGGITPSSVFGVRQFLTWPVGGQNILLNYTAPIDVYIQWIRVWECSGWATGPCHGTILTGSP